MKLAKVGVFLACAAAIGCLVAAWPSPAQQAGAVDPASLIAVLQSADASLHDRALACKQLAVVGDESAVPVLASLLGDEKLSHYARFALEPIPGKAVDAALREALNTVQGRLKLGVINSIGARRDAEAIPVLKELLASEDSASADAAASALARIGTPDSVGILIESLGSAQGDRANSIADALVIGADVLRRDGNKEQAVAAYRAIRGAKLPVRYLIAAVRGEILTAGEAGLALWDETAKSADDAMFAAAMGAARDLDPAAAVPRLTQLYAAAPAERQGIILLAISDLHGGTAAELARQALHGNDAGLQVAALRVLAKHGAAQDLDLLGQAVGSENGDVRAAAQAALDSLDAPGIGEALAQRLRAAQGDDWLALAATAGRRRLAAAAPVLREALDSSDAARRSAAVTALGAIAQWDDVVALLSRLAKASTDEEKNVIREALRTALRRQPDADAAAGRLAEMLAGSSGETRAFIFELLTIVGGKTALETVVQAAQGNDPELQDLATVALGNWMTPDAAQPLVDLIESGKAERFQVRMLRAYIRIARQLNVESEERLAMCKKALELARRDAERELVMEVLGRNPSPASLQMVMEEMGRPATAEAAYAAAVAIGEKWTANRNLVTQAMERVIAGTKDAQLKARAEAVLNRIR